MKNKVFGEMNFDVGWDKPETITCFGIKFNITVTAKAYFEKDGITEMQELAYRDYSANKDAKLALAEHMLLKFASDAKSRFTPKTLLFNRDGSYALLCDDRDFVNEGIAVCFVPKEEIVSQDDYL